MDARHPSGPGAPGRLLAVFCLTATDEPLLNAGGLDSCQRRSPAAAHCPFPFSSGLLAPSWPWDRKRTPVPACEWVKHSSALAAGLPAHLEAREPASLPAWHRCSAPPPRAQNRSAGSRPHGQPGPSMLEEDVTKQWRCVLRRCTGACVIRREAKGQTLAQACVSNAGGRAGGQEAGCGCGLHPPAHLLLLAHDLSGRLHGGEGRGEEGREGVQRRGVQAMAEGPGGASSPGGTAVPTPPGLWPRAAYALRFAEEGSTIASQISWASGLR